MLALYLISLRTMLSVLSSAHAGRSSCQDRRCCRARIAEVLTIRLTRIRPSRDWQAVRHIAAHEVEILRFAQHPRLRQALRSAAGAFFSAST